jgi:hypothetical protein
MKPPCAQDIDIDMPLLKRIAGLNVPAADDMFAAVPLTILLADAKLPTARDGVLPDAEITMNRTMNPAADVSCGDEPEMES